MITITETQRETAVVGVDLTSREVQILSETATDDGQTLEQFLRSAVMDFLRGRNKGRNIF